VQKCSEISIYIGELTDYTLATELKKLSVSFPNLESTFFNVLAERIKVNGFSDERLKDAVGFLIDNFTYQKPSIANIISFDKRIKLYTQTELLGLVSENKASLDDYFRHWINGNLYRVKKSDAESFGITKYLNQENK
jgi:hypothetical protein